MNKLLAFIAIVATIGQLSAYDEYDMASSPSSNNSSKTNWFSGSTIESKLTSDFQTQGNNFAKSINGISDWFPKEDTTSDSSYSDY